MYTHDDNAILRAAADQTFTIEQDAFGSWLAERNEACTPPVQPTRVGVGQSNLTFEVADSAGRRWVLRRPPLGRLLASAHDVAREARILTALAPTDVPVPRIIDVRHDDDAALVLMEHVDGIVLDRTSNADLLTTEQRHSAGISLARTLTRVHAVDLAATGLIDLASHKPYAPRQVKRWTAQWQTSKTREFPLVEQLADRLLASAPAQTELTLVHGDYNLRNVITSPESGEVAAVLDWELCTLGEPLADLGCLLTYWPAPGEPTIGDLGMSTLPGFPSRDELIDEYLGITGRDRRALSYWHALGLWKLAVIAEGVLRRTIDDPRNRAAAGTPTAEVVNGLVELADEIAGAAGY
ncbi:phosphotransferase family protein [Nocardia sp. NPDC058518]|uniref:phosphotransferase family protein n=1 Tax=Nocardia sp. NPDC058518 TaxID=3346534 RepID=UPI00365D9A49